MHASRFIEKWKRANLKERAAAQEHFLDLCELFDHPKPADADPTGEWFAFEKGAEKLDGGEGWADVWKRGFFAWEYKGKHINLDAALRQLKQYRDALENPPLLVACDMDRFVIHTNFTNTPVEKYEIPLVDLGKHGNLEILRAVFHDPEKLKPGVFRQKATEKAAHAIGEIAITLGERGLEPHRVARFLDRIVFCLFSEDVGLLPDNTLTNIVRNSKGKTAIFCRMVNQLFEAMAEGTTFGTEVIRHFNGDLFGDVEVLELNRAEIEQIGRAAELDWGKVDASIFGTLFERGLDPDKRSQLGAHYTSRVDIETLVDPVVMLPLRREWDALREQAEHKLANPKNGNGKKAAREVEALLHDFLLRIASVKVLDPACGSGNFLYVTLHRLLDLDKEVRAWAFAHDLTLMATEVGPWQLYGIEVNPYAHDLAQTTVWIGYLQWMHDNESRAPGDPVLQCMHNFKCMDAIIDTSDPDNPTEPEWPEVDFIVGNPPFLGDKLMRGVLGDEYVERLRALYADRLPGQSDICCYWFERARQEIERGRCKRAGLLATQGIRGGANREVLKRIKDIGDIFFAESDRPWILDGANVHVSMVGFDDGSEQHKILDGVPVEVIHPNLGGSDAASASITEARPLASNAGVCFLGVMKAGAFDIPEDMAAAMLRSPNPNGKPNSDVLRPRLTARDILQRLDGGWIVDFDRMPAEASAPYTLPWEHLVTHVKPDRAVNRRARLAVQWWMHGEPRPGLRAALRGLRRFVVTPEVSKHRIFTWLDAVYLADHQTRAFARSDDYFFGVLHSRLHEVWALKLGTRLETRPRYTPTTCFETFPFPEPTPEQEAAIAEAARELDELREAWLNPPEWTCEEVLEFPGSIQGPWARYVHDPDSRGIGTVRYPRIVPRDPGCAELLSERTLTNLYNERPTWLDNAHRKLDEAVFAAYGWDPSITDAQILANLLELNLARAAAQAPSG